MLVYQSYFLVTSLALNRFCSFFALLLLIICMRVILCVLFGLLFVDEQPSASDCALEAFRRRLAAHVSSPFPPPDWRPVDGSPVQVYSI